MAGKCLVIADDLTGGADTGARFAARGLSTLMVSLQQGNGTVDCSAHPNRDVLVVNTDTRGAPPRSASQTVSRVFQSYREDLFPLIYKKVDSTLRGNIGPEVDAILEAAGIPLAFFAPSFPEQSRAVVGGILIVNGSPLALADVSRRRAGEPDSHVQKILAEQSSHPSAVIDLHRVAMGGAGLREAIEKERQKGARILIFDALRRRDLEHIAAAAFDLEKLPLFVGSAGLAGEVAKILTVPEDSAVTKPSLDGRNAFAHVFLVCGSKSGITHEQIACVERAGKVKSFELDERLVRGDEGALCRHEAELADQVAAALADGHVLLRSCSVLIDAGGISGRITKVLARIVRRVLEPITSIGKRVVLVVTGGATASGVFLSLGAHGFEILGELVDGIAYGRLLGGGCHGLTAVTKAGGFGNPDCFADLLRTLEEGFPPAARSARSDSAIRTVRSRYWENEEW